MSVLVLPNMLLGHKPTIDNLVKEYEEILLNNIEIRKIVEESLTDGKESVEIPLDKLILQDSNKATGLYNNAFIHYHALNIALRNVIDKITNNMLPSNSKERIEVRLDSGIELPIVEARKVKWLHSLVKVRGVVVKITKPKSVFSKAVFRCSVCGIEFPMYIVDGLIERPSECPNINCDNENPRKFELLEGRSIDIDYQEITIQEDPEEISPGRLPRTIEVRLFGDLVETVKPGDKVILIGIPMTEPRVIKEKKVSASEIYIRAVNIIKIFVDQEKTRVDESEIMDLIEKAKSNTLEEMIYRSIAPSIHGYDHIKKAIAALLFGGVPKTMPDGTRIRDIIHILLVGDPGTAKSQLLRFTAKVAPRAVFTTGKGSTAAGLTAAVVKKKDEWSLEAGALVIADRGVAVIDEFDKMRDEDRAGIHEAMEQQQISISKAGIVTTLNARTSILAAANPKLGKYDESLSVSQNINLPPTILSRFDLIFLIIDKPDEERDKAVTQHILRLHAGTKRPETIIPPEKLKKYIIYAREKCKPKLTERAIKKLEEFFIKMRRMVTAINSEEGPPPIPITYRQLESLVRLTEAHARMLLKDEADEEDAEFAINLMKKSLEDVGMDPESGKIDISSIYTGVPKRTVSRYYRVMTIIKELSRDYPEKIPIEEVFKKANEEGIDEEFVKKVLSEETRAGTIAKIDKKHIKLMS